MIELTVILEINVFLFTAMLVLVGFVLQTFFNNFNPKITAKQLVKNILRTFRPSTGAIFKANNVPQTGWLATTPY